MPLFLLILAWLSTALADPLRWSGPVEPGHVVLIELFHQPAAEPDAAPGAAGPEPVLVARFLSADEERRTMAGWQPDLDEHPGRVRIDVPELWLAPGDYHARITTQAGTTTSPFETRQAAPRMVPVRLPPEATGVRALRFTEGRGHDGWAFAPAIGGVAFLPLGEGEWTGTATGPGAADVGFVELLPDSRSVEFRPLREPPPREPRPRHGLVVALGLVPVSLLFVGLGALGAWRGRRTPGLPAAIGCGMALALVALSATLPHLREAILMGGPSFTDPPNSAALLEATADSILSLSDVSDSFQYPEGHSWLVLGPSWLGYLPALPVVWLLDGIAAHNFGVFFGITALFLGAWALARTVGAGPVAALGAGVGAVLAPSLWSELSALSLDRITLFAVPVFFLCLERAARSQGWRWPVAAGVALAAVFYGQVYYGVYLAVACPLLVLSRLVGPAPHKRLLRLATVGAVAALLLLPGAWALQQGTSDTVYAGSELTFQEQLELEGRSLADPLSDEDIKDFIAAHDRRRGDNQSRPTETPRDLLLVAVTNSIQFSELWSPSSTLTGHGGYWAVVLASLLLAAPRRRGAALRLSLDTAILMVFALGPILRTRGGEIGGLMPYYAAFVAIPGMEQLKHPDRFVLLASCISTVPIALGIDGLLRRLTGDPVEGPRRGPAWTSLRVGVTALLIFPMVTVTLRGEEDSEGFISLDTRRWLKNQYLDFSFVRPQATRFPRSEALAAIEPGPALFLPVRSPTPESQYMLAVREGLPMVNEPPHGQTRGGGLVAWTEDNALLNRAAWLSGTDRPKRLLEPGLGEVARADLLEHGLQWIVLSRDALAGPELEPALVAWMDETFQRVGEDAQVIVWSVDAPPAGSR